MRQRIFISLLSLCVLIQTSCQESEDAIIPPDISISGVEVKSPSEVLVKMRVTSLGNQGEKSHGVAWSESPEPTIDNNTFSNFMLSEGMELHASITGLKASTKYYFRFYIVDNKGNVTYSESSSVTSSSPVAVSFSPEKGSRGTAIILTGTNLSGGKVKFDGIEAEFVPASQLTVKVPTGLVKNKVKITVEVAGVVTEFLKDFTYLKGEWTQMENFPGTTARFSPGFSANGYGYAGLEYYKKDFWRYDPVANTWTQMEDFPGVSGMWCSHFIIDDNVYIISGPKREVWCYNTTNNTWSQKKNFPGASRDFAASFSINGVGFYGLGNSVDNTDFWKYDPSVDEWTRLQDFPGLPREFPVSTSLDGSGYVACGMSPDGIRHSDIWKYDPLVDSWEKKKDLPGMGRDGANIFVINTKIYLGSGSTASTKLNDYWEYDPLANEWVEIASIPVGRTGAFGFVIDNKVYVGSGIEALNYTNSFWRLDL